VQHDCQGYWKATQGLRTRILIIWFAVSFGAGIVFAKLLNRFHLGGFRWALASRTSARSKSSSR
jgi:uncharacterized membrane protein